MATVRTFIAVEATDAVRNRAASLIERLRTVEAKVNWVAPKNMHWTLKFLGDVELTRTAEICRRVGEVAADQSPFEIEVSGAGAFPKPSRPRTIWVGATAGTEPMIALAEAIQSSLAQLGFKPEARPYTPHLTIGRVRGQQNVAQLGALIEQLAQFDGGSMYVDEVIVFASRLERDGPVYEALGRAGLGG